MYALFSFYFQCSLRSGAYTHFCRGRTQHFAKRPDQNHPFLLLSSRPQKRRQKKKQTTLFTKYSAGHVFLLVFFTSHNDPQRFTKTHKLNNAAMIAVQTLLA